MLSSHVPEKESNTTRTNSICWDRHQWIVSAENLALSLTVTIGPATSDLAGLVLVHVWMMMRMEVFTLLAAVLVFLVTTTCSAPGADLFGYKEDPEDNPYRVNAQNRTPIYIPNHCGENEILYPGDRGDDWVCDCRPAHVYHPVTRSCYPLYTKAYCEKGQYVEIPIGSKLPQCINNICKEKEVPYNGKCVLLNKNNEGLCPTIQRIRHVIGVNETTLQLGCIAHAPIDLKRVTSQRGDYTTIGEQTVLTKEGTVLFLAATKCAPGSAAQTNGTCEA
ncbi:uncharacterized protein LOC131436668 [Malaya genurostris]|uniref:uncharacterized protein LOC131436668 n=1 Tax=Malaya genurostris TaxID=325434 RepID=UPI0026F3D4E8|nr:uncharacterized protein LOC131436668 [Malaya genurostris]